MLCSRCSVVEEEDERRNEEGEGEPGRLGRLTIRPSVEEEETTYRTITGFSQAFCGDHYVRHGECYHVERKIARTILTQGAVSAPCSPL